MKRGWKLFAAGAALGAAVVGAVAYRKYQDRYELIEESEEEAEEICEAECDTQPLDDDFDFEPIMEAEDDLCYYEVFEDQIFFEE